MNLCKEHSVKSDLGCPICWQKMVIANYEAKLNEAHRMLSDIDKAIAYLNLGDRESLLEFWKWKENNRD